MKKWCLTTLLLPMMFGSSSALDATSLVKYQKAIQLINEKNYDQYYRIKAQLRSTDLYPYLQYLEIVSDPDHFKQSTIQRYIATHKNSYWVTPLKNNLAKYYAENQQWELFKTYYQGNGGASGACWEMTANYTLGDENALNAFTSFWQQRISVPSECDDLLAEWAKSKYMTQAAIDAKVMTLANAGRLTPAIDMMSQYKVDDPDLPAYLTAWRTAFTDPVNGLSGFYTKYHQREDFEQAFNGVIASLANRQADLLATWWTKFSDKDQLSEMQQQAIIVQIAIGLARTHNALAPLWFDRVNSTYANDLLWSWKLRYAIYTGNFKQYLAWYPHLSEKDQAESVWQYWLARSYAKTGQEDKAKGIYENLAKVRSYYGFMSADRLNVEYNLSTKSYAVDHKVLAQVSSELAVRQARDLYQLEIYDMADGLWCWQMEKFNTQQLLASAVWAGKHNMYQQSVFAYGKSSYRGDLQGRFPFAFKDDVNAAAKQFNLPPSVILSVMKQESLFGVYAQSFADAQGLMQLLPTTATFLAKRYRMPFANDINLFNPQQNIMLGSANLFFLDSLFKDNIVLGLASYNAGQGNVGRWIPEGSMEADQWIESIPFGETRHYVRGVLSFIAVYEGVIFNNPDYHLSSIMPQISQASRTR